MLLSDHWSTNMPQEQNLIDLDFALTQLGGNKELLMKMLTKFQNEFADAGDLIESNIATQQLLEAKNKAHTAKGLAGNLGLKDLFDISRQLDEELRADNLQAETLATFKSIMKDSCDAISELQFDQPVAPDFTGSNDSIDYKSTFIDRLERHEFIDDETLHKYIDSLNLENDDKVKVRELVEELQYPKALSIVKRG